MAPVPPVLYAGSANFYGFEIYFFSTWLPVFEIRTNISYHPIRCPPPAPLAAPAIRLPPPPLPTASRLPPPPIRVTPQRAIVAALPCVPVPFLPHALAGVPLSQPPTRAAVLPTLARALLSFLPHALAGVPAPRACCRLSYPWAPLQQILPPPPPTPSSPHAVAAIPEKKTHEQSVFKNVDLVFT